MSVVAGLAIALGLKASGALDRTDRAQARDVRPERLTSPTAARHGLRMVRIAPEGPVSLGSPRGEYGRDDDEGRVAATLTPYALGDTEVSQGLWREVMGTDPVRDQSRNWGGTVAAGGACERFGTDDDLPVFCVTWHEAIAFCNALSKADDLTLAYDVEGTAVRWLPEANGYRLPTEAEWEVAARSGEPHAYGAFLHSGLACEHENMPGGFWFDWRYGDLGVTRLPECADRFAGVAPVGPLQPNPWGLHDMLGNVREWTWDAYDPQGVTVPPLTSRPARADSVVRGGAWATGDDTHRAASRDHGDPTQRDWFVGLRVARSL